MGLFRSHFFVAVVVLAGATAVILLARWGKNQQNGWAPRRSLPGISLGLLGALVIATGLITWRHDLLEHQLSRDASKLAGFSVKVDCQSLAGAAFDLSGDAGSVNFNADGVPQHRTLIRREQCGYLHDYLTHHGRQPTANEIIAVHVLTHETMHMRGITDESRAECAAIQRDAQMARLLGASGLDAHLLAVRYWTDDYPRMPDAYRTDDCASGGRLDEHLADGWPTPVPSPFVAATVPTAPATDPATP